MPRGGRAAAPSSTNVTACLRAGFGACSNRGRQDGCSSEPTPQAVHIHSPQIQMGCGFFSRWRHRVSTYRLAPPSLARMSAALDNAPSQRGRLWQRRTNQHRRGKARSSYREVSEIPATACGSTGTCRSRWTTGSSSAADILQADQGGPLSGHPLTGGPLRQIGCTSTISTASSWKRMCENAAPTRRPARLNKYQCWEVARPGKVGTGQLRGHRRLDSRGAGRSPGAYRQVLTDRGAGSRNASKWPGV